MHRVVGSWVLGEAHDEVVKSLDALLVGLSSTLVLGLVELVAGSTEST
jgi:hypothetical protein